MSFFLCFYVASRLYLEKGKSMIFFSVLFYALEKWQVNKTNVKNKYFHVNDKCQNLQSALHYKLHLLKVHDRISIHNNRFLIDYLS